MPCALRIASKTSGKRAPLLLPLARDVRLVVVAPSAADPVETSG